MVLDAHALAASQGVRQMRRAVFLDRDGTLVKEIGYLKNVADLELIEGAPEALRMLSDAGYLLFVVTNQAGVARGFFGEETVKELNLALDAMLRDQGVKIEKFVYCPHHPDFTGPCECRKPAPGMLFHTAEGYDVDFGRSYMVGDKADDIRAGQNAGTKTGLVLTGYGKRELELLKTGGAHPDLVAENIKDLASLILKAD